MKKRLKAETRRSELLERKVKKLEKSFGKTKRLFSDRPRSSAVYIEAYTGFLSYKYNSLKSTNVWNTAGKIFSYSRRSLLVARIFKYAAAVIAFIESSAVFLISGAVLLLIIPISLAFAAVLAIIDSFHGRKYNKIIIPKLKDKKILFLIAKRGFNPSRGSFFDKMALDFATESEYFVFVVSKSLRDGIFLTAKTVTDNLVVIREPYFFRLMKFIKHNRSGFENTTIVH